MIFEIRFSILDYCLGPVPESCLSSVALIVSSQSPMTEIKPTVSLFSVWQRELCKKAKLQARIKPTALCSAIDKENLIEFLLDFLHYLYNYYMVCVLSSHAYHVTNHVTSCDVMWLCDTCDVTLSCTLFCIVSPR